MTRSNPSPLAFFWAVQRPSNAALCAAAAVLAFGVYLAATAPGDASTIDAVMALALILQTFTAASGFRQRCRRGYFDPVMTSGAASRCRIAAAHGLVAAAPGLVLWALAAALAFWIQPGVWPTPAQAAPLLAVCLVSAVAWASSLPTVQYAAGSIWMLALVGLGATHRLLALRDVVHGRGWIESLRAACAVLMCPLLLLSDARGVGSTTMGILLVAASGALFLGAAYISRFDARLTETD